MDIRSILTLNQHDHELQNLIDNCTLRKKDILKLASDCRSKLTIYEEIMQQVTILNQPLETLLIATVRIVKA